MVVPSLRMDYGLWTDNSRGTYNKWDGVARSTIQVLKIFMSPIAFYGCRFLTMTPGS